MLRLCCRRPLALLGAGRSCCSLPLDRWLCLHCRCCRLPCGLLLPALLATGHGRCCLVFAWWLLLGVCCRLLLPPALLACGCCCYSGRLLMGPFSFAGLSLRAANRRRTLPLGSWCSQGSAKRLLPLACWLAAAGSSISAEVHVHVLLLLLPLGSRLCRFNGKRACRLCEGQAVGTACLSWAQQALHSTSTNNSTRPSHPPCGCARASSSAAHCCRLNTWPRWRGPSCRVLRSLQGQGLI